MENIVSLNNGILKGKMQDSYAITNDHFKRIFNLENELGEVKLFKINNVDIYFDVFSKKNRKKTSIITRCIICFVSDKNQVRSFSGQVRLHPNDQFNIKIAMLESLKRATENLNKNIKKIVFKKYFDWLNYNKNLSYFNLITDDQLETYLNESPLKLYFDKSYFYQIAIKEK